MIGRDYLARQAMTLLKMAKITRDPAVAAELASKAADFNSRSEEKPSEPSADRGAHAPDVIPPKT